VYVLSCAIVGLNITVIGITQIQSEHPLGHMSVSKICMLNAIVKFTLYFNTYTVNVICM